MRVGHGLYSYVVSYSGISVAFMSHYVAGDTMMNGMGSLPRVTVCQRKPGKQSSGMQLGQ